MLFVWVPIIVAVASLACLIDDEVKHTFKTIYQNRDFLWKMYTVTKFSSNLNHTFLLMCKLTLMGERYYSPGESPWDTYKDMRSHYIKNNSWPYLMKIDNTANRLLSVRQQQDTSPLQPKETSKCLNFSSYSYLNAVRDISIRDYVVDQMQEGNYHFGNHGPRMLGGNNQWLCKLEQKIASFVGKEKSICFSSGFLACKSAIQAVSFPNDIIFADGKAHESLRDGIRVAKQRGCKVKYFKHNNYEDLKRLLKGYRSSGRNAFIIVESVYSMDGDFVNLPMVKSLADQFDCKIILDESHGLGIVGETGRGIEELQHCKGASWLIIGSLTKSFSSVGGYVAGSDKMIQFLHFFGSGTMFSAPMSVPAAIAAYAVFERVEQHPEWVQETRDNMNMLKKYLEPLKTKHNIILQSDPGSPLIAFIMQDYNPSRVVRIGVLMMERGFYVAAVNPPACELRSPRLRLTAPRGLSQTDISNFAKVLDQTLADTLFLEEINPLKEVGHLLPLFGM